jgi:O-antigen/teichoic acid export membrane protein
MSDQQTSYRQIMKATSIFGGVQVFQIIIQVIRSKFIAVLLGPAGMGIVGLLTSTTGLISSLTNFGLGTSAVKDVAAANASGNDIRIATIVTVLRRWVWITGLLGTILTLILSPWLSQLTFGNRDYTLAFIWLSITLLFQQLSTGQLVLLQGMRKLQHLAKASITGSLFGLFISVPIYYFYGIDGIVPAIILSSITTMVLSWYFAGKVVIQPVVVTRVRTLAEGREMLKMGLMISLTGLIGLGVAYLVRIYISHKGGVAQVGLYNAGFMIINTYVGLVFTAMGTDYYPRLAGVASDRSKTNNAINQQAEIAVLILAPILAVFLVFISWIVILLYSTKFVEISGMIHWAALGMFFKATSWAIAFILLAKGASKLFFWNEVVANIYMLALNLIGYKLYGLDGLGISFLIGYLFYLLQVYFVTKFKYSFAFDGVFYKIFSVQLLIAIMCFLTIKMISAPYSYLIGSLLIIVSTLYSLKELDKRIGLMLAYHSFVNKISKK